MTVRSLIDELTALGADRRLEANEVLCHQGDDSESAFVIIEGKVETSVATPDGDVVLNSHGPGALVGEVTALVGGQRTATLRAVEPVIVKVIPSAQLRAAFDANPEAAAEITSAARDRTDRSRVAALLANELGTNDEAAIAAIAARVTWLNIEAGHTLFEAGDEADAAYLVLSGRLSIVAPSGTTVAQVGRGAIVGEFGLLEDRTRTASVAALRDSSLARLSAADFAGLAANHTNLAMGLVRRIVERSGVESSAVKQVGRSACVLITAPLDGSAMLATMAESLTNLGSTVHLWPARVDELLGAEGASDIRPGDIGDVRLVELLHQMDANNDHVLLEGDLDRPAWTSRAIRRADQAIIVCSADPLHDEDRRIREILALVPDETPIWLALNHPAGTERPVATAAIRDRYGVDEVHHLRNADPKDLSRLGRLAVGEGFAIVLSGGGARGFAHTGVIAALEEHGIPIDRVAGASMGSVIGAGIAEGVAREDRVPLMQRQFHKLLDYTLPVVSLIKGKRISDNLEEQWGEHEIEDLWLPFSCVTTNLTTSAVVALRRGPVDLAVRASTAIPGVLPPVPYHGELLIDGGVLDNLPVSLVVDDPSVGTIIAIDAAPPRGPRAKSDFGLSVSGWSALRDRFRKGGTRYPDVVAVLMRTMLIGAARDRDEMVASGRVDLYLDLELRGVSLLDFDTAQQVNDMGYEATVDRIGAWWESRGAPKLS